MANSADNWKNFQHVKKDKNLNEIACKKHKIVYNITILEVKEGA